jgi:hypothetical protein
MSFFDMDHVLNHKHDPNTSLYDMVVQAQIPDPDPPSGHVVVGLIISNGISCYDKYKCHVRSCTVTKPINRLTDLKHHNASRHNRQTARFWCPVDGCERSMMNGGHAFPRKDKMHDHLERMHAYKVGS